ncbi:Uncharacterised protein [Mycobacteroides abscessus subsp. bolletii]|nr:Uncharacterised protein [Mycobacteroides abscessus subsp. bolletii]SHR30958.1 Uncharacterised protein [Mycobacteroides abscessus subsp. bolletii]SHR83214.1 Uncharacterised protein [Mycobacteroides abscessus subsp. bolletii]SHS42854.1 Uncharacterised protein [Mycobacteroides abscessus subsp. bolletii]SHX31309.1 Uncharacterised protein [Mycobacteroides abscessus subsp. bolletii]
MLVPLRTVNGVLGISHSRGYVFAQAVTYPIPHQTINRRYFARKSDILQMVGLADLDMSKERADQAKQDLSDARTNSLADTREVVPKD